VRGVEFWSARTDATEIGGKTEIMSWKATAYAKGVRAGAHGEPITRNEKLVLLILADCYNEDRGCAWPSIPRLAKDALMSVRQVQRCLRSLEAKGLLVISLGGRRRRDASEYRFPGLDRERAETLIPSDLESRGDMVTPLDSGGVTNPTVRGDISARRGDIAVSPSTASNNHKEPEEGGQSADRPARSSSKGNGSRNGLFHPLKEYVERTWREKKRSKPTWGIKDFVGLTRLLKRHPELPLSEFKARWDRYLEDGEEFVFKRGHSLAFFCGRQFDVYVKRPTLDIPDIDIKAIHAAEDEYCKEQRRLDRLKAEAERAEGDKGIKSLAPFDGNR
jgi:hypothetical protein